MAKVLGLAEGLKIWTLMLFAVLVLLYGGQFSEYLVSNINASTGVRWLGVAVAIGSMLPATLILVWAVGSGDEYHRQIAIVGSAIAFVGDVLVHVGFGVAQDARLVSGNLHLAPVPVAMALWLVGVGLAMLYFRYRP